MKRLLAKVGPGATDMIRADHSRVLATFHRYKSDTTPGTKRALVAMICTALEVHAQIEEEIFYPAMASVDGSEVDKLIPEHDRMRSLIAALRNGDSTDAPHDATVMELMREVMHHVADEETILLPQAERVLGERLGELGGRMMKRRLELIAPHAGELARQKARAMPMTNVMALVAALFGGALLVRHIRRYS